MPFALLGAALKLLPVAKELLGAGPELRSIFTAIKGALPAKADQDTLKAALELAFDERDQAHAELQELARKHGG